MARFVSSPCEVCVSASGNKELMLEVDGCESFYILNLEKYRRDTCQAC